MLIYEVYPGNVVKKEGFPETYNGLDNVDNIEGLELTEDLVVFNFGFAPGTCACGCGNRIYVKNE